MNSLYPAFLKLTDKRALVVGGGNVAEEKIKSLLGCGADVVVIAPQVTPLIAGFSSKREILLIRREYRYGDMDGCSIVIGATDDPVVQEEIYAEACERRMPVNVVDKPELCSFYLGSVFREGELKVAVSTNGKSPTVGKIIRDKIAAEFSGNYPSVIERMGRIRDDVRRSFSDYESRKKILEQYVKDELRMVEGETAGKKQNFMTIDQAETEGQAEGESEGKVFLVGAGPGDPELITLKGLRILRSAGVVLYDALVSAEVLAEAPVDSEKIYVGKRAGAHCMKQEEINRLLVEKASQGKRIVRLKGGDPFIFGRGGEEVEALREAGIEAEVVPGITAGIGVPTMLGLPLTHRREASSVLFLTGHEDPSKHAGHADWESASRVDTVVIYMGTRNLVPTVERLLANGVPSSRPVAVIFGGTTRHEKVFVGTLDDICERAAEMPSGLPGLIVVGETVRSLAGNASTFSPERVSVFGEERVSYAE